MPREHGEADMHVNGLNRERGRSSTRHSRVGWVASAAAIVVTLACQRVDQPSLRAAEQGPTVHSQVNAAALDSAPGVDPGIHPQVVIGDLHNPYAGNAGAATEGRQLFVQYNCSGCHGGRAGGGMGPSLRDSAWIYGNSDPQIYDSIFEGRPNGMPTWGAKISQDQIWKIIAYLRTLGTPQEPDAPPKEPMPPLVPDNG